MQLSISIERDKDATTPKDVRDVVKAVRGLGLTVVDANAQGRTIFLRAASGAHLGDVRPSIGDIHETLFSSQALISALKEDETV